MHWRPRKGAKRDSSNNKIAIGLRLLWARLWGAAFSGR